MPTLRTNIQKGKFSNYGHSKFVTPTKNTQYFANSKTKQPTMRGSFPRRVRWSLDSEGISNRRSDYARGMELNRSASSASRNFEFGAAKTISSATFSNSIYDGNAARKLRSVSEVVTKPKKVAPEMHAVKGSAEVKSSVKSAAASPILVTVAKFAAALVILIAILAFVRVAMTTATVSNGLASQAISSNIDTELINKNSLEVQDSVLSNSSRIKQAASQYALVAPGTITVLNIAPDVLAYDENNNISLVESLNRVSNTTP